MGKHANSYWKTNLRYILTLLVIWFAVSFFCGIFAVDLLDQYRIAGFRVGFWFANQGSILVFCLLIAVYSLLMNRLDKRHQPGESD
ncbi:MAG: DUF4212 domain-containing protein [Desulfuromonas sp.]|nr:MAG: DUF4212 domain-containing protein [Desulfuromonas sp.]